MIKYKLYISTHINTYQHMTYRLNDMSTQVHLYQPLFNLKRETNSLLFTMIHQSQTKKCQGVCQETLDVRSYYEHDSTIDKLYPQCKSCMKHQRVKKRLQQLNDEILDEEREILSHKSNLNKLISKKMKVIQGFK